jgi:hypothetical protein
LKLEYRVNVVCVVREKKEIYEGEKKKDNTCSCHQYQVDKNHCAVIAWQALQILVISCDEREQRP